MDGIELLVHNLSHSDLVLSLNTVDQCLKANSVIARPKFSHFQGISEKILTCLLSQNDHVSIAQSKLCSRKNTTFDSGEVVPVGFNFNKCPIAVDDFSSLRFRQDDKSSLIQTKPSNGEVVSMKSKTAEHAVIDGAYFPLISVLLPKWMKTIDEDRQHSFNKVVVLVSGRGTPMVQTSNNTDNDNSTKCTAELIKLLIQKTYPGVTVKLLHSDSNLFRYDENIVFVKGHLLPLINQYRDQLVCTKGAEWKEHMRVSLSFADGSSARISAINASLRYYRPSYMHFWQLKSFWREQLICEDDIECHSFEEISTEPAIKIENTSSDPLVHAVLQEMAAFRAEFTHVMQNPEVEHDLSTFWLRKSQKPVLAVLLVQKPGQPFKLYRGTNMEVSMPTGSLCAERNVIGTALSADITLRRQDIKIVAVYAASMASSAPNALHMLNRTSSTNSVYAMSKQNSVNFSTQPMDVTDTHSASSERIAGDNATPTTPISNSRRGSLDLTYSAEGKTSGLSLDISDLVNGHNKGVDSSANTPIGSPSALLTPGVGAKRKIMNINGRSDSLTDEPTSKLPAAAIPSRVASNNSNGNSNNSNSNSSLPPTGLARQNNVRSAPHAPLPGNSHRRTKTVAFSSSSNNLVSQGQSQGQSHLDNSPFPDDSTLASSTSLTGEDHAFQNSSGHEEGCNGNGSSVNGSLQMHMLVKLPEGGLGDVSTQLLCSPVGECTASLAAAMNASAQRQAHTGTMHHTVETETITVDKDDLNPLKPCGACNEWLKKIAEVNPQLRVITFTDAGCRGVHIEQIDD